MNRRSFFASVALTCAGLLHAKVEKWLPEICEEQAFIDAFFAWKPAGDLVNAIRHSRIDGYLCGPFDAPMAYTFFPEEEIRRMYPEHPGEP